MEKSLLRMEYLLGGRLPSADSRVRGQHQTIFSADGSDGSRIELVGAPAVGLLGAAHRLEAVLQRDRVRVVEVVHEPCVLHCD